MRLKKCFFLTIAMCAMILCSCGKKGDIPDAISDLNTEESTEKENIVEPETNEIGSINVNYGKKYLPYGIGSEAIGWFKDMAGAGDYIYTWGCEVYNYKKTIFKVYVVDLKSGIQLPLCNKTNCEHAGGACNACVDEFATACYGQPYDDKIMIFYSTRDDEKMMFHLTGVNADGSGKHDYGSFESPYPYIYPYSTGYWSEYDSYRVRIEDGYMYCPMRFDPPGDTDDSSENEYIYKLYRMSLSDGKNECVYEKKLSFRTKFVYDVKDGDIYVKINTSENGDETELKRIDSETLEISDLNAKKEYGCFMPDNGYCIGDNVRRNNSGKFLISHSWYDEEKQKNFTEYVIYDSGTGEKKVKNCEELWGKSGDALLDGDLSLRNFIDEKYIYLHHRSENARTYIYDFDFNPVAQTGLVLHSGCGRYFMTGSLKIADWEDIKADNDKEYVLGTNDIPYRYTPNIFIFSDTEE